MVGAEVPLARLYMVIGDRRSHYTPLRLAMLNTLAQSSGVALARFGYGQRTVLSA